VTGRLERAAAWSGPASPGELDSRLGRRDEREEELGPLEPGVGCVECRFDANVREVEWTGLASVDPRDGDRALRSLRRTCCTRPR
jgi:hypothetical protein